MLEDVNFVVKPGETIALVGPTGAGKTTIVNLISRFYDIEQGKILIDGYDLTKVSMNSLRRQMAMTQDNFIFPRNSEGQHFIWKTGCHRRRGDRSSEGCQRT